MLCFGCLIQSRYFLSEFTQRGFNRNRIAYKMNMNVCSLFLFLPVECISQSSNALLAARNRTVQLYMLHANKHTLIVCIIIPAAARLQLHVKPAMVETGLNEWANFSCSLRCDFKHFNIKWAVGFNIRRGVKFDNMSRILEETNNCDSDNDNKRFGQTLRILVDSIDMDKTPVQCLGLPKSNDGETIHFSSYAVLRVNGKSTCVYHAQLRLQNLGVKINKWFSCHCQLTPTGMAIST